jgi:hypothetical protein
MWPGGHAGDLAGGEQPADRLARCGKHLAPLMTDDDDVALVAVRGAVGSHGASQLAGHKSISATVTMPLLTW